MSFLSRSFNLVVQCGFRILNTELENIVYCGEQSQFGQIETSLSSAALHGELMWKCKNVIFFNVVSLRKTREIVGVLLTQDRAPFSFC